MPETLTPRPFAKNAVTLTTADIDMLPYLTNFHVLSTSAAVGTAKLIWYYPIVILAPFTVAEFIWLNGATAAGHIQMGVYNEAFGLLGNNGTTTSQTGTSAAQIVAPSTGFTLPAPGRYYIAITSDDATSTFGGLATNPNTGICGGFGIMNETTGAFGLASTGTPAVATSELVWHCGISGSTAA